MVNYLFDWLHNLLVTLATTSGVGLLVYVVLREFYPATIYSIQHSLGMASSWLAGVNLSPVLVLVLLMVLLSFTLPPRRDRV